MLDFYLQVGGGPPTERHPSLILKLYKTLLYISISALELKRQQETKEAN